MRIGENKIDDIGNWPFRSILAVSTLSPAKFATVTTPNGVKFPSTTVAVAASSIGVENNTRSNVKCATGSASWGGRDELTGPAGAGHLEIQPSLAASNVAGAGPDANPSEGQRVAANGGPGRVPASPDPCYGSPESP